MLPFIYSRLPKLPVSRLETGHNPSRSREIDFLRGLALICIVLDHMQVSLLKIFTLQNYTLFDATELFVFLSGFSIAIAYSKIAIKSSEWQARKRFVVRCGELYAAFLFTVFAMLLIGYICKIYQLDNDVVSVTQVNEFLSHPCQYLGRVLFLGQQPYFSSILPMYIVFCALSIFLMKLLSDHPGKVLLISFILCLLSGVLLPHTQWSFNPFAWQFIFVAGLFCYLFPFYEGLTLAHKKALLVLAWILVISFATFKILTHYQFQGMDKLNLASVRIISFFSAVWLIYYYRQALIWLMRYLPAIEKIGTQSLACFVASTIISLSMNTLCEHLQYSAWVEGAIADILGITLLYLVAWSAQGIKKMKK